MMKESESGKPVCTLQSVIKRKSDLLAASAGNELMMLSLATNSYFGLDAIGAHIWGLIEQPMKISDICDSLIQRYDVTREQCEKEVLAFIQQLADHQMIEFPAQ